MFEWGVVATVGRLSPSLTKEGKRQLFLQFLGEECEMIQ